MCLEMYDREGGTRRYYWEDRGVFSGLFVLYCM